jgi:hypothetical protein
MYANQKSQAVNPAQKVAVDALVAVVGQLSRKDAEFAGSLIQGFNRYGRLSDKQMPWVQTLTQRAAQPRPEPVALVTVDFKPIQDLFDLASKSLKRIKIKLQTATGQAVVIHRAGAMSKYVGQVLITDGAPFGQNKFFGRVDTTGEFFATGAATQEVCQLVKEFSENPKGIDECLIVFVFNSAGRIRNSVSNYKYNDIGQPEFDGIAHSEGDDCRGQLTEVVRAFLDLINVR